MPVRAEPALMSWHGARQLAGEIATPGESVRVPLAEALGATLAEPLRALTALPGYEAAAMDGYAVAGAGPWYVSGRVLAGDRAPAEPLQDGCATEVATGAAVPYGAAAVLPYEDAARDGDLVSGVVDPGRHVRRRDEVCAAEESLLPAGTVVTPAVLGLAASVGHDDLEVRRPDVAVLITGDELRAEGVPAPGQVRDALGPMLPGIIRPAGGSPHAAEHVGDRLDALAAALERTRADVVVCCGASSAGPADHLRTILTGLDAAIDVDGVACRPGHPQLLARLPDDRVVVGLPGNPYAALVAALTLLGPLLHGLAGRAEREREWARLSQAAGGAEGAGSVPAPEERTPRVVPHPRDTRLVAVRRDGRGGAVPVGHDRPGGLWGAALADALAVVPPGWEGQEVELLPVPAA